MVQPRLWRKKKKKSNRCLQFLLNKQSYWRLFCPLFLKGTLVCFGQFLYLNTLYEFLNILVMLNLSECTVVLKFEYKYESWNSPSHGKCLSYINISISKYEPIQSFSHYCYLYFVLQSHVDWWWKARTKTCLISRLQWSYKNVWPRAFTKKTNMIDYIYMCHEDQRWGFLSGTIQRSEMEVAKLCRFIWFGRNQSFMSVKFPTKVVRRMCQSNCNINEKTFTTLYFS